MVLLVQAARLYLRRPRTFNRVSTSTIVYQNAESCRFRALGGGVDSMCSALLYVSVLTCGLGEGNADRQSRQAVVRIAGLVSRE